MLSLSFTFYCRSFRRFVPLQFQFIVPKICLVKETEGKCCSVLYCAELQNTVHFIYLAIRFGKIFISIADCRSMLYAVHNSLYVLPCNIFSISLSLVNARLCSIYIRAGFWTLLRMEFWSSSTSMLFSNRFNNNKKINQNAM